MVKCELPPKSYLRIFYAFPDSSFLDVMMDEVKLSTELLYEDFTEYFDFTPGKHTITFFHSNTNNQSLQKPIFLGRNKIYTGILAPHSKDPEKMDFYLIEEPNRTPQSNYLYFRFANFSTNTPPMNLYMQEEIPIFRCVSFTHVTNYLSLPPGVTTIIGENSTTSDTLFTLPNTRIKPNRFYSLYVIGNQTSSFPIKLILPLDGQSYLKCQEHHL